MAAAMHKDRKACSSVLDREAMATGTFVPARTPQALLAADMDSTFITVLPAMTLGIRTASNSPQ